MGEQSSGTPKVEIQPNFLSSKGGQIILVLNVIFIKIKYIHFTLFRMGQIVLKGQQL